MITDGPILQFYEAIISFHVKMSAADNLVHQLGPKSPQATAAILTKAPRQRKRNYSEETDHLSFTKFKYGGGSWVWLKKNERRINTVEIRSLRNVRGVSLKINVEKVMSRERCGLKNNVVTRLKKGGEKKQTGSNRPAKVPSADRDNRPCELRQLIHNLIASDSFKFGSHEYG
ncbi:hypothetical protein EVAR_42795_1 [Eumeta japonica]|uniref:Uncharacterized protein n=1 Tax=Eumeta variegata TaxID=151549 RepID=A0A4C1WK32_EUMVA|nr:hypothetical protein EVAR_42795_1 [Eumeta japonica]